MKPFIKVLTWLAVVATAGVLTAFPVMWLWNALMPDIFGLVKIGFAQALGLNLLSGFLLKPTSSTSTN